MIKRIDESCTFDTEKHLYLLNGIKIPSCTEILTAGGFSDYSCVRRGVMEKSANDGAIIHKLTEFNDRGTLDDGSVDPKLVELLDDYNKVLKARGIQFFDEWIERPVYHPSYKYGVTPDRIGKYKGEVAVFEIKTTASFMPECALQTAGQKLAVEAMSGLKVKRRFAIRLKEGQEPKVKEHKGRADEFVFIGAVNGWHWRNENKRLKKENGYE